MAARTVSSRDAILAAAMAHFAEDSYTAVGLRSIAATAEVDVALVIRHFGSKLQLFEAAVENLGDALDITRLDELPQSDWGRELARQVLSPSGTDGRRRVLMMLRATASPATKHLIAAGTEANFVVPMTGRLTGRNRRARALQVLSALTGAATVRYLLELDLLTAQDIRQLERSTAQLVQALVDGNAVALA